MITEHTDATFKFHIADAANDEVMLKPELDITLRIKRRNEDGTIDTRDFPCVVDLEDNTAFVTIPKSYLTENATHQFQIILKTATGSIYRSHVDSFFVCQGMD